MGIDRKRRYTEIRKWRGGEGTVNFDGKTKYRMGILLRVSRRIICKYQGSGEV